MMNILGFHDYIVEQYGDFKQVLLTIEIPEKELVFNQVPVSFLSDYSGLSLSMLWEDAGVENPLESGLYYQYFTTGENMTYVEDDHRLIMVDPEGKQVIVYGKKEQT